MTDLRWPYVIAALILAVAIGYVVGRWFGMDIGGGWR